MVEHTHHRQRHIRHRSIGAVMVITLIAVILLAGMVFYIINLGRQANARIVAQHAADAAAAAGAGWIARSFNTVAMNNVSTARMIVTVGMLDAMPMVLAFTREDQIAALESLNAQLNRGVTDGWVRDAFLTLNEQLQQEIQILDPLDVYFNQQYDVREMTYYDGPDGRGTLWRAMEAMDEFSQATMENIGVLAQLNAIRGGEVNLERDAQTPDETSMALMVPFAPQFAWVRGEFDDFERPVREGLLPLEIDDKTTNRGPYDTVFGWRFGRAREIDGYNTPGGDDGLPPIDNSGPRLPGTGAGRGNSFVVTKVVWENYGVEGPLDWMLNRFDELHWSSLYHSRFSHRVHEISKIKLSYCWPGDDIKQVIDPEWVTDLDKAVSIAAEDESKIHSTNYFRCEIKSVHPRGSSQFMQPGTWRYVYDPSDTTETRPATIVWMGGWVDPRNWDTYPGVTKLNNHMWREEWEYKTYSDTDLGLALQLDAQGNAVAHTVYRIDEYAFMGVDIGEGVDVRNPFNFGSKADLPAPIDFDHSQVKSDDVSRREKLTYLAAAQRSNRSLFWPTRFDSGKPYPHTVGLAQVAVFNTHSWDLWTQMWHAQLERIEDYDDWVSHLADYANDVGDVPELDAKRVDSLFTYLKSIEPLADVMLMH